LRIEKLVEYGKYVGIGGYKNVRIENVELFLQDVREKMKSTTVQFLNAKLIARWEHLFFAVLNALTAFKNSRNISNSLAIEILLFASAQRQIKRAFQVLGIRPETSEIAIVIVDDEQEKIRGAAAMLSEILLGSEDDSVLEINEEKFNRIRQAFNIGDEELKSLSKRKGSEKEALTELVIEHVALLATQR
jgi:KEOPS complex subunit Cgi121